MDISLQARETKEKINKWDYIKLKSFCTAKGIFDKIKGQPTEWGNIYSDTSDKGLISKIYEELIQLNNKKPHRIQLKMGKRPEQTLLQKDIHMANRHEKMLNITNR